MHVPLESYDRSAYQVRRAIQAPSVGTTEVDALRRCLDSGLPLDELCRSATEITAEHFSIRPADGATLRRRMLLYAPLYLSSYCTNQCVYCGFRHPQPIQRKHLDFDEARRQADILYRRGFRHILLVAGDYPRLTTPDYFARVAEDLAGRSVAVAVEIAPQPIEAYAQLAAAGVCGVTLYQETYDETLYARYHPRGSKASYDWRLAGLDRVAAGGIRRLGLGFLLGLADPREELVAVVRHAVHLKGRFPECSLAFSLPRIREAPHGFVAPYCVDDDLLVRMYCALRMAVPQAMLVLSTRESPELRNRLARICITQLSAGSSTVPGGYDDSHLPLGQQFPVCDHRPVEEVAAWLRAEGFEVTWK